jgi:thioredoxin reductase (NADPH)
LTTSEGQYDIVIAGQGASAYAAALYAARYQTKPIVIGETFGGETAIGGLIENYPGYSDIDGFDLMMHFREQVEKYEVPIVDDKVAKITGVDGCFEVETQYGGTYQTQTVILGVGRERRKLGLEHEDEWTGRGVSFCSVCDAPLHRNNTVAVVGGGNAAVEGAILLSKYATKVYLTYRGDKFVRPEQIIIKELNRTANITQLLDTNVTELKGTDGLDSIMLDRPHDGSNELKVDGIFMEIGADPRTELPKQLGLNLNDQDEVIVDKSMRTNVPGIFAAGDLTDASGDLKQTITAAAQGAIAASSAYKYLREHPQACPWHAKALPQEQAVAV